MAGSRKGERRGGARPHAPKFIPETGKIRNGITKTVKGQRVLREKRHGGSIIAGEKERQMIEIITGRSELMPRDIQLTAMRELFALAQEYQRMLFGALQMVPSEQVPMERINATVASSEAKMVQYLMLSSQVARDAAPYIHPRLAALAVTTDRSVTKDLFDLLLEEIDQQPRMKVVQAVQRPATEEDEEAA